MEEKKLVAIRSFPVKLWQKARQAAIGEEKTIGQWVADIIKKYLQEKNGEEDK